MENTTKNSEGLPIPTISLPKGGGAIRGIGGKFAANPGTGTTSVPIMTSPGRAGLGPQLALAYDSGGGNGAFGLGWNLALPAVTRKTDKGLPRYFDSAESDVFVLSGAEDLVPMLASDGRRFVNDDIPGYRIYRYLTRIEGLFARIERWVSQTGGGVHWRSFSKDNFSIRHEFPTEWARAKSVLNNGATVAELKVVFQARYYPFWSRTHLQTVKRIDAYAKVISGVSKVDIFGQLNAEGQPEESTKYSLEAKQGNLRFGQLKPETLATPTSERKLYLTRQSLEDLLLLITWGK
jgi:hypothetical protein